MDAFVNMYVLYKCENLWEFACTACVCANNLSKHSREETSSALLRHGSNQVMEPLLAVCLLTYSSI